METAETCVKEVSATVSVTQSLLHITENSSVTGIHLLQSNRFFRQAKSNLKLLEHRKRSLKESKNEAIKTRDALLARNKVNITNLESLFQTQSEFFNYKCEMKTNYIIAEESAKNKKQRYENIIAEYRAKWAIAERECQEMPLAERLFAIQKENATLLKESIELEEKLSKTKFDYFQELKKVDTNLMRKIVELSKEYLVYVEFMHLDKMIRKKRSNLQESIHMHTHKKPDMSVAGQRTHQRFIPSTLQLQFQTWSNVKKPAFSVDLTAFDKMLIPFESLEIQNDDDSTPCQKRISASSQVTDQKSNADNNNTIIPVTSKNKDPQGSTSKLAEDDTKPKFPAETSKVKNGEAVVAAKKQPEIVTHCEFRMVSKNWSPAKKKSSLQGDRRSKMTASESSKKCSAENSARAKVKFCDRNENEVSIPKKMKPSKTTGVADHPEPPLGTDDKRNVSDSTVVPVHDNVPSKSTAGLDESANSNNSSNTEPNKSNFWLWTCGGGSVEQNVNPSDGKFTFFTKGTDAKKTKGNSSSIFALF